MKRFVLAIGIIFFVFGYFQLRDRYTFIELTPEQREEMGSVGLASSSVVLHRENGTVADIIFYVGKYAVVRR